MNYMTYGPTTRLDGDAIHGQLKRMRDDGVTCFVIRNYFTVDGHGSMLGQVVCREAIPS